VRGEETNTLQRALPLAEAGLLPAAGALLLDSLRRHRALTILIVTYALLCEPVAALVGAGGMINVFYMYEIFPIVVTLGVLSAGLAGVVAVVLARPSGSLYAALKRDLAARFCRERLVNLLIPVLLTPLFFGTFSSFKTLIPFIAPFSWDETFMRWDRWLHGDVHPWQLVQPLLGTRFATVAIDALYYGWIPGILLIFTWQVVSTKRAALRMRFLISFLLSWMLIGTVLATALSSAGPCYFGRITGLADPYVPLIAHLQYIAQDVHLFALSTQDMLWQAYQHRATTIGSGISAMPSMHVAIAVLLALFGWRLGRRTGWLLTIFLVLTMLGSVHLGWHYAIDGYVSGIVSALVWFAVGWVQRRAPAVFGQAVPETLAGDTSAKA
jgi:PAP2 superfamily protein